MRLVTYLLALSFQAVFTTTSLAFTRSLWSSRKLPRGSTRQVFPPPSNMDSRLFATDDESDQPRKPKRKKQPTKSKLKSKTSAIDERQKKKEEVMKQLKAKLEEKKRLDETKGDGGLLNKFNPFQAGQSLRKTIGDLGTLTTIGAGLSDRTRQKYYLDDRFLDGGGSGALLTERNPNMERLERDNYVPEVLVVGATGEVGRLVVRRLLLEGRFRVRVLVRDLYSQTLNLLGTGVTYCQGDLNNIESLEYALTDVDKIVFCAGAPRPDETDFQTKFKNFVKENLASVKEADEIGTEDTNAENTEWEQLTSVMNVRSELAEQVDCIGMQNLVSAYQNVRFADYGTPQAAKRSLFKFGSRPEDFNLFAIDDYSGEKMKQVDGDDDEHDDYSDNGSNENTYGEEMDEYDDDEDFYDELYKIEERKDSTVKTQVQWIRNEFGHGVFVGRIPTESAGEAAVVSSRLRSREEPEKGINLSSGFAGFIVRLCGDGATYECFIRTGSFEEDGIEYVCEFATTTKRTSKENKSRNKFITSRLPFQNFKPVLRKEKAAEKEEPTAKAFRGEDARFIGFRYRSEINDVLRPKSQNSDNVSFYLALSYMKVYREQPEPEFVYLSDSRIPPIIRNGMVRHDQRQLLSTEEEEDGILLLDERSLKESATLERSPEETYYKFRGEEILKKSGLSYTIIRVSGFNEDPSGEASTIDLTPHNKQMSPVSRAEAAQVCVSALLDSSALNKSVYMTKKKSTIMEEDISAKFSALSTDKA